MTVFENFKIEDIIDSSKIVTSIGGFDGIHLGHQALFKKAYQVSKGHFQIVTFNQIPKIYFNKNLKPILSQEDRIRIFDELKPKNIIFLDFKSVNGMNALDFCELLKHNLKTEKLVIGKDFKFGNNRVGDVNTLLQYFGEDNVILLDDYLIDSEKVSTTKIRLFYAQGNIQDAEKYLGRKISYSGSVVKGKQLGSTIGVPTANILLNEQTELPRFGVYAIKMNVDNQSYLGCLNVGVNPTVDKDTDTKIEIHLLDFEQNIYNRKVSFELIDFIRDEQKFNTLEALKAQITLDITQIKNNF